MHGESPAADGGDAPSHGAIRGDAQEKKYLTEAISAAHSFAEFRCKKSPRVEGFFVKEYPYFTRTGITKVYVYTEGNPRILGYYTLSAAAMTRGLLKTGHQKPKKMPAGIDPPMARIGFLGRDDAAMKGLGAILVKDAARRAAASDVGVWGLVLDPETPDVAKKFYEPLGFIYAGDGDESSNTPKLLMYAPLASLVG